MAGLGKMDLSTTFYIDYALDNGKSGAEVAKSIYEAGFRNIYLAAGFYQDLPSFPWVRGVIQKRPPWSRSFVDKEIRVLSS
jgi:hypothetical protein